MPTNFIKKILIKKQEESFYFEDDSVDEITDEIEKSLWILKEAYDFPTEEIERSIESRHRSIKTFNKSN